MNQETQKTKRRSILVSKEIANDSETGRHERYSIYAEAGDIIELTFDNIIFIRDKLSEFIAEKETNPCGNGLTPALRC